MHLRTRPPTPNDRLRIAIIGKKNTERSMVARYLYFQLGWKRMRLDDGVARFIRYSYFYQPHQRIKWETRFRFYDALYKLDPDLHIGYLLRRLRQTTWNVVVEDARYINEILRLQKEAGFITVRVSAPETKKIRIPLLDAASGTIKLQEYFGSFDAFPVDYSISVENRQNAYRMMDRIVEKERAKLVDKNNLNVLSSESDTQNG